ncbi:MFS transporter [Aliikangiella maris]|uniref:MFS transporter n=2 Tax=Aliikangiella maris TaxID=3162458 RepID=A0ABV3MLQ4_9GAMM
MKDNKKLIGTVLFCHFLASFTALGMPLFLPKIMADLINSESNYLIGWYYILPTICMAFAASWWGVFADRYGRRLSLLRAQAGLAVGFLIAGFANNLTLFTLGLLIQGVCGGTYAASNAYLATQVNRERLPTVLNWTQFSARLSLLVAPIIFGLLITSDNPRQLYCYLAILPLFAAILVYHLPKDELQSSIKRQKQSGLKSAPLSFLQILLIQFLFSFSMVVSFPYFLPFAEQLGIIETSIIGFYFSLPHLVYLIITSCGLIKIETSSAVSVCLYGLLALIIAALIQMQINTSLWLWLARLTMGLGITLTFISLHQCFAALKNADNAGLIFGRFDSAGKWAGVTAGLCSGFLVKLAGLNAPFLLSAIAAVIAIGVIYFPQPRYLTNEEDS